LYQIEIKRNQQDIKYAQPILW